MKNKVEMEIMSTFVNWCFVSGILNDCFGAWVRGLHHKFTINIRFEFWTNKQAKENKQTNKQKTGDRKNFTWVNNTNHTGTKSMCIIMFSYRKCDWNKCV